MMVIHELSDNVFSVSSVDQLEVAIKTFLTGMRLSDWSVSIDGDKVLVSFPDVHDIDAEEDERIVIGFCNSGRFGKARKVIREWTEKIPWNSEAYRLAAQVEMMEGNIDDAIEKARVSLKLNPRNLYALILLGNLIGRDKGMPEDAVKWYKRASELYPDSSLAVNNYAGCLLQSGKYDRSEVEALFHRAIKLDKTNLQSYYGLASIAIEKEDYKEAFLIAREGLLNGTEKPENPLPVREVMTEILVRVARELSKEIKFDLIKAKSEELAKIEGIKIELQEDGKLPVMAKMEFAERYGRDRHRLVYSPRISDKGGTYLLMQELEKHHMHLEARANGRDGAFVCDSTGAMKFKEWIMPYITGKFRSHVPLAEMDRAIDSLRVGLGGQVMNTPLDYLSEIRTADRHPELSPDHVVASYLLCIEAIESARVGEAAGVPKRILQANRVMNAVMFMLHRRLTGLDMVGRLNLTKEEKAIADKLLNMCEVVAKAHNPGDEWDVVREYIEELRLGEFFNVEDDASRQAKEKRQKESNKNFQDRIKSGADIALNMAITMHMVDAIRRLREMDANKVRIIAAEIAMLGTRGISPDKKSGYSVPALDGEDMSGPRMLAYYYVSWKIGFPEKVDVLGLPFEKEYETALAMVNRGM
jgi:tetratricopeptide (TPR) repeat protein